MNYLNVRLVKSAVAGVLAGWLLAAVAQVIRWQVWKAEGWPLLMCTTVNRMPKR